MDYKKLEENIKELVRKASFILPADVSFLIRQAYKKEKNKRSKTALGWILDNAACAAQKELAICQDTGFPVVFIEAGKNKNINSEFIEVIEKSIEKAYKENYLRASIVEPLERKGSTYKGIIYHISFSKNSKKTKISIFPKGFGSENKSKLKMFNPTANIEDIEKFIVSVVEDAGPEACPPFFIGVGIGGTADKSLLLSKEALLDDLTKPNPNKFLRKLEERWLKKINSLRIGAMGFGGRATALALRIKTYPTHIAGLPVGVSIGCHALRKATIIL